MANYFIISAKPVRRGAVLCRAANAASRRSHFRAQSEARGRGLEPGLRAADRRCRCRYHRHPKALAGILQEKRFCLADLVALERPDLLSGLYPEFTVSAHGLGFSAENWCVMPKLGNQLYLAIDAGPIHDEDGKLIAVVETLRDMTDQKRAELALQALASSDGLTGLANRRCFDQTLALEWARAQRTKSPLSLLLVDVDHFKLYNDLHGHQKGDDCLRAVAGASSAQHAVRPLDLASPLWRRGICADPARHGLRRCLRHCRGDPRCRHGVADRPWRQWGRQPRHPQRRRRQSHPRRGRRRPDRPLGAADQALYAAKRLGRNRVVCAERILAEFARVDRGSPDVSAAAGRRFGQC